MSNSNPEKPFEYVKGVPMCVACNCHVVTEDSEMDLLEGKQPKEVINVMSEEEADVTIDYGAR